MTVTKDTVELLKAARELISDKSRWTQLALARDKEDKITYAHYPSAVSFCALGAIEKNLGPYPFEELDRATSVMRNIIDGDSIVVYNDSHTHDKVLKLFDDAIASAEKELEKCS